jgi:hypothetical protein
MSVMPNVTNHSSIPKIPSISSVYESVSQDTVADTAPFKERGLCPQPTLEAMSEAQARVEQLFGEVDWKDDLTGYLMCPGRIRHTTQEGGRDCRVKIDGVATLSCVHESCKDEITVANKTLRDAFRSLTPVVMTKEQKKLVAAKVKVEKDLKIRTIKSVPSLLKAYSWSYDKIVAESPHSIAPDDREAMFRAFLSLFENDDVLWIGDVGSSGQAHHVCNFKTKTKWLTDKIPLGPFTCPSCFEPGVVSRSKDKVAAQRYLVVESDSLSKDQVGAIFKWLDKAVGLTLLAVVDTAGKSLHGWFEYPPPEVLAELKIMLPVMGCDPKMFGASQPCRLPGGLRDGRIQRLIYSVKGGAQ